MAGFYNRLKALIKSPFNACTNLILSSGTFNNNTLIHTISPWSLFTRKIYCGTVGRAKVKLFEQIYVTKDTPKLSFSQTLQRVYQLTAVESLQNSLNTPHGSMATTGSSYNHTNIAASSKLFPTFGTAPTSHLPVTVFGSSPLQSHKTLSLNHLPGKSISPRFTSTRTYKTLSSHSHKMELLDTSNFGSTNIASTNIGSSNIGSITGSAPIRTYKTGSSVKLRCRGCYFVRRHGRLFVECELKPRHKQMQTMSKYKLWKEDYDKGKTHQATFWRFERRERFYWSGETSKYDYLPMVKLDGS